MGRSGVRWFARWEHDGFRLLDRALELGVFHWDTACSYNQGAGNSERLVGRYFAARGRAAREQVVLATKIKNSVRREHESGAAFTPNQSGASRVYIRTQVEACLQRLQTDWIDVLYLHSPVLDAQGDWVTPLAETWSTLDDLVTAGKVHYLAVSNQGLAHIEASRAALEQVGKDASRRIVLVQNRYNLLERAQVTREAQGNESAFLDTCQRLQLGLIPYYPLASGALTGRYRAQDAADVPGRITSEGTAKHFLNARNRTIIDAMVALAEAKGCTLAQLAIAWLLRRGAVTSVIAGVTRLEQIEDNAGAPGVELTDADMAQLDALSS